MNLAGPDLIVILLIVLVLFGAKKLPELAKGMGQAVREFQKAKDEFSDELKSAYRGFGLDIPGKNGAEEWALPISATYVIDRDGTIVYAYTDADYRDRADPADVLRVLKATAAAA